VVYSEDYQAVEGASELLGFGVLNEIVEGILKPSEWLKTTFGDESKAFLQQWMQTTFLTKYKAILGSGRQNSFEILNKKVPKDLGDKIEEAVVCHFDKVIAFALDFFNTWTKKNGIKLKVSRCHY